MIKPETERHYLLADIETNQNQQFFYQNTMLKNVTVTNTLYINLTLVSVSNLHTLKLGFGSTVLAVSCKNFHIKLSFPLAFQGFQGQTLNTS